MGVLKVRTCQKVGGEKGYIVVVQIFDATGRMSRREMRRPLGMAGLRVADAASLRLDICRPALNGSLRIVETSVNVILYNTRILQVCMCMKEVPLFLLRLSSITDLKINEM
jgi:hypothetical protein